MIKFQVEIMEYIAPLVDFSKQNSVTMLSVGFPEEKKLTQYLNKRKLYLQNQEDQVMLLRLKQYGFNKVNYCVINQKQSKNNFDVFLKIQIGI